MTQTLLILAGLAFAFGYILKGLILSNVNYLGTDEILILIPFAIILIVGLLFFTVFSDYLINQLLIFLKALYFALFSCVGLVFCNFTQRMRGLSIE